MIQRAQTVYLFFAAIASILMLFFPIFNLAIVDDQGRQTVTGVLNVYGVVGEASASIPLFIIFVLTAMLSILAIFLYKNRRKQLLVCRLNLLFQILVAISFLLVYFFGPNYISTKYTDAGLIGTEVKMTVGLGYYILFLGIPFLLLAIRGIRADEDLLKSLDRLR
ncbi:MAG: DUF4293 domain-containing protein [Putridiphycobacter sp.]|nr:DUF4293 domain-containing protein [Putridiphycobacter sp.]